MCIRDSFYRADWARAEGGYGLGLAIAKTIADLHHGRLWAENCDDGVTFRAEFRDVPVPVSYTHLLHPQPGDDFYFAALSDGGRRGGYHCAHPQRLYYGRH